MERRDREEGVSSSEEHGLRVDVSEGAEQRLAEYLPKSSEPEKAVRNSVAKAGRDLAREATLGQHKQAKRGGRTPFQILADLRNGEAQDWALWVEWLKGSHGRKQLTWSADLRELAGLAVEQETDEEIAEEVVGTDEDTSLVLPVESWRALRQENSRVAQVLTLAEKNPSALREWLTAEGVPWV